MMLILMGNAYSEAAMKPFLGIETAARLAGVSTRHFKQLFEHATNIAEMVIFLVEGQDIRHAKAAKA